MYVMDDPSWSRISQPILTGCTFSENSAVYGGGGIYNVAQLTFTVTDCIFSGNWTSGAGGSGGGMAAQEADMTGCVFIGNSAERGVGGGLCIDRGDIMNCVFSENTAQSGGGIYVIYTGPRVHGCVFNDNRATTGSGGGGVFSSNRGMGSCLFTGNSAATNGGAVDIANPADGTVLVNCTFSGNFAQTGGAVHIGPEIEMVFITDCILWGDKASIGCEIALDDVDWQQLRIEYSDVEPKECAIDLGAGERAWWLEIGNIDADPCFVDPGCWANVNDTNIPVEPNHPNAVWVDGDYHLQACSPCINAGDPGYWFQPGETDIDGDLRIINGRVDMGADEHNWEGPLIRVVPEALLFEAGEGGADPNSQIVSIYNAGLGTLSWEASEGCSWLDIEPVSGESFGEGEVNEVTLSVDISGLAFGAYYCELLISDGNAINSPEVVSVSLNILSRGVLHVPSEYNTIQDAIDWAWDGAEVVVGDGTYTGAGNRDIDFRGKAITVRSESGSDNCIIDCEGTRDDPHLGFYFHSGEDANSVLEGLNITGGCTDEAGGIYCYSSSPTIRNCRLFWNESSSRGYWRGYPPGASGIFCSTDSHPRITRCEIAENSVEYDSGNSAVFCLDSNPIISNCIVSANMGGSGITIWGAGTYTTISNCIIAGNDWAGISGGGGVPITNCTVVGNRFFELEGEYTVTNSIVWGQLGRGGGDYYIQ